MLTELRNTVDTAPTEKKVKELEIRNGELQRKYKDSQSRLKFKEEQVKKMYKEFAYTIKELEEKDEILKKIK